MRKKLTPLENATVKQYSSLAGFTLIEIIIVLVVIGILSTFAAPQFAVTKERALDKEAKSVLLLIREAERSYRMEENTYYPEPSASISDINLINTELRLTLPVAVNPAWVYSVDSRSTTPPQATAARQKTPGRILTVDFSTGIITCDENDGDRCFPPY